MIICYRDDIGIVTVDIDMESTSGIAFDGQFAYFTDTDGRDYQVSTRDIIMIGREG